VKETWFSRGAGGGSGGSVGVYSIRLVFRYVSRGTGRTMTAKFQQASIVGTSRSE
jgi:hypothetical protein